MVYPFPSRGSAVELFDLERIEVVKGPQGTLFGRGAEIGALHLVRHKPVNTLGAEVTLGYGSHNDKSSYRIYKYSHSKR